MNQAIPLINSGGIGCTKYLHKSSNYKYQLLLNVKMEVYTLVELMKNETLVALIDLRVDEY